MVIRESFPAGGGVTSALGVNDRGVTQAGESFTPLTPAIIVKYLKVLNLR